MENDKKYKTTALILIVLLALVLRLWGLGSLGFNDDEMNKLEAARSYQQGNFRVNLEHPMLMKSLVTLSLSLADFWNHTLGQAHQVGDEIAVRLPNVVFGSLMAVVVFLIAQEFFGFEVALISGLLWAVGIIPIIVNRLAKEDTLLVFFAWLAYYHYIKAKTLSSDSARKQQFHYAASGACFGLMLASKYFPHYMGLIFLYFWYLGDKKRFPPRRHSDTLLLFGTAVLVFLIANPVILWPGTLKHMLHYANQESIIHHGYLVMGHFASEGFALKGGMPFYFYALFLLIKTPLPVLALFVVGLVHVWRHRNQPGPLFVLMMFLLWIVPFSVMSGKWLRYMLSLMPSVTIISAIGAVKIFDTLKAFVKVRRSNRWILASSCACFFVFFGLPLWTAVGNAPFYALYLNPLGRGRVGYFFPNEEFNDVGLRELALQICNDAPKDAEIGSETPQILNYYFGKSGRNDLHSFRLTDARRKIEIPPNVYIVVQDGRKYLENIELIQQIESHNRPLLSVTIRGRSAARVYHTSQWAQLGCPK